MRNQPPAPAGTGALPGVTNTPPARSISSLLMLLPAAQLSRSLRLMRVPVLTTQPTRSCRSAANCAFFCSSVSSGNAGGDGGDGGATRGGAGTAGTAAIDGGATGGGGRAGGFWLKAAASKRLNMTAPVGKCVCFDNTQFFYTWQKRNQGVQARFRSHSVCDGGAIMRTMKRVFRP